MTETLTPVQPVPAPVEETADAPPQEIDLSSAQELDARGLNCPLPVLRTKKVLNGLASGQILKVVSTDPGSVADMAAFSRRTKNEILEQSEGGGEYTFFFRKA